MKKNGKTGGVRTEAGRRYYPDGSFYSGRNAGAAARELEYIDITLRENPPKRKRSREEILGKKKEKAAAAQNRADADGRLCPDDGDYAGVPLWKIIGFCTGQRCF